MCGCTWNFTCTRCWPGLVGSRDWRDLPLRTHADLGEWTEQEIAEQRSEQGLSRPDYEGFKDAA